MPKPKVAGGDIVIIYNEMQS